MGDEQSTTSSHNGAEFILGTPSVEDPAKPVVISTPGIEPVSDVPKPSKVPKTGRGCGLIPFVKGDPRCWRKGRPRTFYKLQELAQKLADLPADQKMAGKIVKNVEFALRTLIKTDPAKFLEIAYGKIPVEVVGAGDGGEFPVEFIVKVIKTDE